MLSLSSIATLVFIVCTLNFASCVPVEGNAEMSPSPPPETSYKTEKYSTPDLNKIIATDASGQYSMSYTTSNGIRVSERSYFKLAANGQHIPVREGSYSYTSPEGIPTSFSYIADENGYRTRVAPIPMSDV